LANGRAVRLQEPLPRVTHTTDSTLYLGPTGARRFDANASCTFSGTLELHCLYSLPAHDGLPACTTQRSNSSCCCAGQVGHHAPVILSNALGIHPGATRGDSPTARRASDRNERPSGTERATGYTLVGASVPCPARGDHPFGRVIADDSNDVPEPSVFGAEPRIVARACRAVTSQQPGQGADGDAAVR
jgi:hypothetical protein